MHRAFPPSLRLPLFVTPGLVAALIGAQSAIAQVASFRPLGNLDPSAKPAGSQATGISADGRVVVGESFIVDPDLNFTEPRAFRWTLETGMVDLGLLPTGLSGSAASRCSDDGSVVGGLSGFMMGNSMEVRNGGFWTSAGSAPIAHFLPSVFTVADVTADGAMVVGATRYPGVPWAVLDSAFYWTEESGLVKLGPIPGGTYSSGQAVSADGSVIVGFGDQPDAITPFWWTPSAGLEVLPGFPLGAPGWASGVSPDGSTILGTIDQDAFRWTKSEHVVPLGHFDGAGWADALDASADGSVIVGYNYFDAGMVAFIWDAAHGMRDLRAVLVDYGVNLEGWTLESATGISADGLKIVGFGINPDGNEEAWLATLPGRCAADFNGDAFVDGIDYDTFMNAFEAADPSADFNGDGFVDAFDADQFVNRFESGC